MYRRSPRLIEIGYYNPDRQISYREAAVRRSNRGVLSASMSEITLSECQRLEAVPLFARERAVLSRHSQEHPVETVETEPDAQFLICAFLRFLSTVINVTLLLSILSCLFVEATQYSAETNAQARSLSLTLASVMQKYTELEIIAHSALNPHKADDVGMTDFALATVGSIVNGSSQTYKPVYCKDLQHVLSIWCKNNGPATVIQPEVFPGKCWAFEGSQGHLVISLSFLVRITHVSLEHLPQALSPANYITTAPKYFAVFGMINEKAQGKCLGVFTYDRYGNSIQTFKLLESPSELFRLVELRILSNWGHPEYTCVYRFRVHSMPMSRSKNVMGKLMKPMKLNKKSYKTTGS